jgi:hypothetical protein
MANPRNLKVVKIVKTIFPLKVDRFDNALGLLFIIESLRAQKLMTRDQCSSYKNLIYTNRNVKEEMDNIKGRILHIFKFDEPFVYVNMGFYNRVRFNIKVVKNAWFMTEPTDLFIQGLRDYIEYHVHYDQNESYLKGKIEYAVEEFFKFMPFIKIDYYKFPMYSVPSYSCEILYREKYFEMCIGSIIDQVKEYKFI